MSYKLEIEIKGVPKLLLNVRMHWRAVHAEKKRWRERVLASLPYNLKPKSPLTKAGIRITRFSPRTCDYDNRVSSYKAVQDALVEAGILLDDTDAVIVERHYPWEKCRGVESRIKIEVWEI